MSDLHCQYAEEIETFRHILKTPLATSQIQSQFKIGLITYKILNQGQPVYLRELIHPYTSSRNTRRSTPNSSSFKPPLLIAEFTN